MPEVVRLNKPFNFNYNWDVLSDIPIRNNAVGALITLKASDTIFISEDRLMDCSMYFIVPNKLHGKYGAGLPVEVSCMLYVCVLCVVCCVLCVVCCVVLWCVVLCCVVV
jgi:hypothetical protein